MLMVNKNIPGFATVLPSLTGSKWHKMPLSLYKLQISLLDCAIMGMIKQKNTLAWKIWRFCVPVDIEHIPPLISPPSNCTAVTAAN